MKMSEGRALCVPQSTWPETAVFAVDPLLNSVWLGVMATASWMFESLLSTVKEEIAT